MKVGLNNANLMRTKREKEVGQDLIRCTSERSHPSPPPEALSLHTEDLTKPKEAHCAQIPHHTLIKRVCTFHKPGDWQSLISPQPG